MDLERQLGMALAPCRPAPALRAAVMERVSAANWRASQGLRRKPGKIVLLGTLLVVAAAAAMLAVLLRGKPTPAAVGGLAASSPAPQVLAEETTPSTTPVPATAPEPAKQLPAPQPALAGVKPFTASISLRDTTTDKESKATLAALHAALLQRLRLVPGLTLVDAATSPDAPVTYYLTLQGGTRGRDDKLSGALQVELRGPDGKRTGMFLATTHPAIAPRCVTAAANDLSATVADPWACSDPAGLASFLVGVLRRKIFPPDASLRLQLREQLLDQRLSAKQRLTAMGDIAALAQDTGWRPANKALSPATSDPQYILGAINLASATDPTVRAQVWRTLRGLASPQLLQPLLVAAREEVDDEARLEAVSTLASDFTSDERARVALGRVAGEDPRPLVRAVAQRGLEGEDPWKAYVLASLKDGSRTDNGRIEALVYYMFDRQLPESVSRKPQLALDLLDEEASLALVQVLPKLRPAAGLTPPMLGQLTLDMTTLVKHPAMTDLLVDALAGKVASVGRTAAAFAMLGRDEPRVREALRERRDDQGIRELLQRSSTDPDPQRRQMAIDVLKPD